MNEQERSIKARVVEEFDISEEERMVVIAYRNAEEEIKKAIRIICEMG